MPSNWEVAGSPLLWLRQRMEYLREWIWQQPIGGEPWWHNRLRELLRVLLIFIREFDRDRIPLRASALTFTIMLSLVPTLALGTAVLKGLGADDQMRQAAHRFIDQMESATALLDDYVPAIGDPRHESAPEQADPEAAAEVLPTGSAAHLRQAIDQIFAYVDRTDFTTLGAFGVIGLVVAVVVVLGSIERSMNAIWHSNINRPMGRRVMDYLALMILLPLAINLTFATEATLKSETLRGYFQLLLPIGAIQEFLLGLMPLLLLTLTFTILYRFLPNTRVKMTPALLGGLFGAVAWLIVQGLYLKLQIGVARYNAIYGSFATLPLFLIWLQLCWIIFLSGAEMAFAVQARRTYRMNDDSLTPVNRLTLAFAILDLVQRDFKARRLSEPEVVAETLHQPVGVINQVAENMVAAGLLRWAGEVEAAGGYLPGTDLTAIAPTEIVDLIMGTDIPPLRGGSLVMEAMEAARRSLKDRRLPV